MVETKYWLSMRHFVTKEYINGIYMGQQQYEICNTNIKENGLLNNLDSCTIFASTLTRSKQTVDFVVSQYNNINFEVVFSDNLIERGLGDFEGKSKIIIRQDPTFFINNQFLVEKTPPNGEKFEDFRSRVNDEIKVIMEEHKKKNVLIISHLQVLRMIHFCVTNNYDYSNWHNINYAHGEIMRERYGK